MYYKNTLITKIEAIQGHNSCSLREKNVYYEELVHRMLEAEKAHDLPSVSWKLLHKSQ